MHRSVKILGFPAALALVTCAMASAEAAEKKLAGSEITALYSGANTHGSTPSGGGTYHASYKADGTMSLQSGSYADTGKWSVEGDHYCSQWAKSRDGAKLCFEVYAEDGFYKLVDDKGATSFVYFDSK